MNKTICVSVVWVERLFGKYLTLITTHACEPIDLGSVQQVLESDKTKYLGLAQNFSCLRLAEERAKEAVEIAIFGQPATFSGFPDITCQPLLNVDMTPDESFPLRILKAYRVNCDCKWKTPEPNPLYDKMNEDSDKRAMFLDKAIEKLEKLEET